MIQSNCYIIHTSGFVKANSAYLVQNIIMEKRILGIILSLLGVAGLIYAGVCFMNGGDAIRNIKAIIFSGVLGAIFFFAGIGLIRNTKDKAT
jgi:uncharacterized membrane protein